MLMITRLTNATNNVFDLTFIFYCTVPVQLSILCVSAETEKWNMLNVSSFNYLLYGRGPDRSNAYNNEPFNLMWIHLRLMEFVYSFCRKTWENRIGISMAKHFSFQRGSYLILFQVKLKRNWFLYINTSGILRLYIT